MLKSILRNPIVFQPTAHRGMQRGVNKIVGAIRPTLGPRARVVVIDRVFDGGTPEVLDNGATIAQRIIQISDRNENAGAMLIREMVVRVGEQVGDGTATAAVIFQHLFNEGIRHLTAGGDAVRLCNYLELGAKRVIDELNEAAVAIAGKEDLAHLAETLCHDSAMAELMGEIFDIVGEHGRLEIRHGRDRGLHREYVEGMYWDQGVVSRLMLTDMERLRTELIDPGILISDLAIAEPGQLVPVVELALANGIRSLLLIVGDISDSAVAFLQANTEPERFVTAVVKAPGWGREEQAEALQDLAALTGGRPFISAAGETFASIGVADLGRSRRAWADRRNVGIVGGLGDGRRLRQHIASLRCLFEATDNLVKRDKLLARIGRLLGGSATLWVGGDTEMQIEERVDVAKRTARAMRGAMMEGVVAGGGVALLACQPALAEMMAQTDHPDERAACRILSQAIAQPFHAIVANAGYDATAAMAQVGQSGEGFDVRSGATVNMETAGIMDAAAVQKAAVFAAVTSAALALGVAVVVHRPVGQAPTAKASSSGKRKIL